MTTEILTADEIRAMRAHLIKNPPLARPSLPHFDAERIIATLEYQQDLISRLAEVNKAFMALNIDLMNHGSSDLSENHREIYANLSEYQRTAPSS